MNRRGCDRPGQTYWYCALASSYRLCTHTLKQCLLCTTVTQDAVVCVSVRHPQAPTASSEVSICDTRSTILRDIYHLQTQISFQITCCILLAVTFKYITFCSCIRNRVANQHLEVEEEKQISNWWRKYKLRGDCLEGGFARRLCELRVRSSIDTWTTKARREFSSEAEEANRSEIKLERIGLQFSTSFSNDLWVKIITNGSYQCHTTQPKI